MELDQQVQDIMARLIEARKASGLSQAQAAKLLGFSANTGLSRYENENTDSVPDLRLFLQMCDIYMVSPVWVLTGTNPEFDDMEFDRVTQFANAAIEDIDNLKRRLKMLNQIKEHDDGNR